MFTSTWRIVPPLKRAGAAYSLETASAESRPMLPVPAASGQPSRRTVRCGDRPEDEAHDPNRYHPWGVAVGDDGVWAVLRAQ